MGDIATRRKRLGTILNFLQHYLIFNHLFYLLPFQANPINSGQEMSGITLDKKKASMFNTEETNADLCLRHNVILQWRKYFFTPGTATRHFRWPPVFRPLVQFGQPKNRKSAEKPLRRRVMLLHNSSAVLEPTKHGQVSIYIKLALDICASMLA